MDTDEFAKRRFVYGKLLIEAGCNFEYLTLSEDMTDLTVNGLGDDISFDMLSRISEAFGTRKVDVGANYGVPEDPSFSHTLTIRGIHPKWQCSGCKLGFMGRWKKKCPSCGRDDYWSGSVAPEAILWDGAAS